MATSCTFEEMTLVLLSGCKTNLYMDIFNYFWAHHVPPDFEIYVEWYLNLSVKSKTGMTNKIKFL